MLFQGPLLLLPAILASAQLQDTLTQTQVASNEIGRSIARTTVASNTTVYAWSAWGSWSACSRSCGGGVAVQERQCLPRDPARIRRSRKRRKLVRSIDRVRRARSVLQAQTSVPDCPGLARRYHECNTSPCPGPPRDPRADQCAVYDRRPFRGRFYTWVPYVDGDAPCTLNCRPRGQQFYASLALVADGTPCTKPGFRAICVQGSCKVSGKTTDKCKREISLSGRRIVHMENFLAELKIFGNHSKKFGCSLDNMICVGEKRSGLSSKFSFQCNFCNYRQIIKTDSEKNNVFDINKSAVSGIVSIGGGCSALEQLMSAIDVPAMSEKIYQNVHAHLSEKFQETAEDSMAEAAAKEREAALEEGMVDENGTPIIDVIADGSWAKRSYRTNYSSLSGAAAIIGKRFGQVLFLAVRNKYCSICEHAKKKNYSIDHKCYKNFEGSSTSMEADILVEGFKSSVSMYNIIFGRLISDGDSSTYCKILEARPYPNLTVEKIECTNHLLRNFTNKMRALTSDTRFSVSSRKLVTVQRILSMRRNIKKTVQYYKDTVMPHAQKIDSLHSEINNILLHVFHSHNNCKDFYCSEMKPGDTELCNQLRSSGLWLRLSVIVSALAAHARSLIHGCHSNMVESFNCTIAKFIGGKRINFTSRGSYQARCYAAALMHNSKEPLTKLQCSILNCTPSSNIKNNEKKRLKRYQLSKKNKKVRRRKNYSILNKQKDYGATSEQPDMDEESFEKNKKVILENLRQNSLIREKIQKETILQRENTKWMELRRKMLTASNFGAVITRRDTSKCASLVKKILNERNLAGVSSIQHGIRSERTALKQLETQENIEIKQCGLFIDQEYPFLGASPDGFVEARNIIVEVKCPITAFKLGLEEAIKKKKVRFWSISNGVYKINKNHHWYYQIQGQLHITKKNTCLFAVWSGENSPLKTELIDRDDEFWSSKMAPKLIMFYLECLLPEIVDSRLRRGMSIREPKKTDLNLKENNDERTNNDDDERTNEPMEYEEDWIGLDELMEWENTNDCKRPEEPEILKETERILDYSEY